MTIRQQKNEKKRIAYVLIGICNTTQIDLVNGLYATLLLLKYDRTFIQTSFVHGDFRDAKFFGSCV